MEFNILKGGQLLKHRKYCPNPVIKYGIPAYADSRSNPKVVDTLAYHQWWEEQLYYIHNGYTTGGITIPGRYYKFVNFDPAQTAKGVGPMELHDYQLDYAYWIDHLKSPGVRHNAYVPKARRKALSVMTVGMVIDYGWRFKDNYHAAVVAGLQEYADDFMAKWKYINMHMVKEFRVRTLKMNDDEVIAGWREQTEEGWVDKGTQNTIYIKTVNNNPNVLKGKFLNDIVYEESGENELLLETIAASEDCLRVGNVQYGTSFIYGCVCAGTKVWDNFGNLINIEDLKPENGILGFNGNSISKEKITYWQPPREKECYKIITNTGRTLECSDDHPILYSRSGYSAGKKEKRKKAVKFIETKNLKVGDQVAIIESVPVFGDKKMWEPRLIGWLIGDGTYGIDHSPRLFNCDKEINNIILTRFDSKVTRSHITKDGKVYEEIRLKGICKKLRDLGIYGQTKLNKRLPNNIHSYSKKDISELIGGFFDADGCVCISNNNVCISLTASSFDLLNEIRLLLQKFGIHGGIKRIKFSNKNPKNKNDYYKISIVDKRSLFAFYNNIKFSVKHKQKKLNSINDLYKDRLIKKAKGIDGLRFERIVNIFPIGEKPVYNLTAGTTNTYIANGIVTHNTGGNMSKGSKGFKEINFNLSTYNAERFYVPAYVFFEPAYSGAVNEFGQLVEDVPNLLHMKPHERVGWSDFERGKELIEIKKKELLAKGDMEKYIKFCQNNPTNIDEIFRQSSSNNFDLIKLNAQLYKIQDEKKKYNRWHLSYKKDDKGAQLFPPEIAIRPATNNDPEHECVYILNDGHPVKGYKYLDVAGIDSYDQNIAKHSKSLGAMAVFRRMHSIPGLEHTAWAPLAIIRNRPKYKEQFYELCVKLAIYYDLQETVLIDIGAGMIIKHFEDTGNAKYLSVRPKKFESPNSNQTHQFGFSFNTYSIPKVMSALQTLFDFHIDKIWFDQVLNEALNYDDGAMGKSNGDGDGDLIDALGMAIIKAIDMDMVPMNEDALLVNNPFEHNEWVEDSEGNIISKGSDLFMGDEPLGKKEDYVSRLNRMGGGNINNDMFENDFDPDIFET